MHGWTPLAALLLALATGCASGRPPDARGLDVIIKARPGGMAADDSAARTIERATQCEADFVRVLATGAFVIRLWPTQRAPDAQKCISQLRTLPEIEYAEPDAVMKPSQGR